MQVFKTYFKIMKKQLFSLLLYGFIFLVITVAITFSSYNDGQKDFKTEKVPVLLINNDGDNAFTEGFRNYLEKYAVLKNIKNNDEAIKDALFNREIIYVLTIPKGFTEGIMAGSQVDMTKVTIPDSMESMSFDTIINNYMNTARIYIKYNAGTTMEELNSYLSSNAGNDTKVSFDVKKKDDTLTASQFNMFYFNTLGYIIIGCFIVGVSSVMLSFSGIDIRRRHSASPVTSRFFNLQLILANMVFVMTYLAVFIAAGFIFNPLRRFDVNTLLDWLNAVIFALAVLSISYLIGITVKGRNAVQALSTMLSLSLAFLSGMFVPQQYMGASVLKVSSFTPAYWYVKANNTIAILTDYSAKNILPVLGYMAIQIGFAAAIISVALVVSKRKRQQAY